MEIWKKEWADVFAEHSVGVWTKQFYLQVEKTMVEVNRTKRNLESLQQQQLRQFNQLQSTITSITSRAGECNIHYNYLYQSISDGQ